MRLSTHRLFLAFALSLSTIGCHAQAPASAAKPSAESSSATIPPELARRIEILIRSKSNIPPNYTIGVADRRKSAIPGYDEISVTFTADGQTTKPSTFLLSDDNKSLGQFTHYDISKDPRSMVSPAGRPARGGPADAPVLIVAFDDLECPYCAKLHGQLFPALTARYKNSVRIVYRDFPLDQHPWAMRAAIDTGCLGSLSPAGYWNVVDYIHAHASELGGAEHSLAKANEQIDTIVRDEGQRQKVAPAQLAACIGKQDDTLVNASRKEAETLGVDSTPALFINGERVEGAVPIEYIYRIIDQALVAAGQTPPPPVAVPPLSAAGKPGN